tara:strand:- start:41 stop:679 length:639 start_codon:yes stop_codon:yes gene_type:complete
LKNRVKKADKSFSLKNKNLGDFSDSLESIVENFFIEVEDLFFAIQAEITNAVEDGFDKEQNYINGNKWSFLERPKSEYRKQRKKEGAKILEGDRTHKNHKDLRKKSISAMQRGQSEIKLDNLTLGIHRGPDMRVIPKYGKLHLNGDTRKGTKYKFLPSREEIKAYYDNGRSTTLGKNKSLSVSNLNTEINKLEKELEDKIDKIDCDFEELNL